MTPETLIARFWATRTAEERRRLSECLMWAVRHGDWRKSNVR